VDTGYKQHRTIREKNTKEWGNVKEVGVNVRDIKV